MPVDYHNHTELCGHAVGTMDEYVERAIAQGRREFGFSEHSHWMIQGPGIWLAMRETDLPAYVRRVEDLKSRYDREGADPFHVRLGLEMDFVPSRMAAARRVSEQYDWDYRLGSVHHIGLWNFQKYPDKWDEYSVEDVYEAYFDLMRMMIEARFCDVVSHMDVIKKTGRRPEGGYIDLVKPLIGPLSDADMAVEINMSGMDRPQVGEFYPSWEIVEMLIEARVPITLGSDGHKPDHVGRHYDAALAGLRERGLKHVVRFEKRRMIPVEI